MSGSSVGALRLGWSPVGGFDVLGGPPESTSATLAAAGLLMGYREGEPHSTSVGADTSATTVTTTDSQTTSQSEV